MAVSWLVVVQKVYVDMGNRQHSMCNKHDCTQNVLPNVEGKEERIILLYL